MPITLAAETSQCSASIIEFTVISDEVKTKAVLLLQHLGKRLSARQVDFTDNKHNDSDLPSVM